MEPNTRVDGDTDITHFRERLRAWIDTVGMRRIGHTTTGHGSGEENPAERLAVAKEYQAALFDAGFAGLTWPVESGGQGLSAQHDVVYLQETADYEIPTTPLNVGLGMCGPTIRTHGTDEQRRRYLPPLLRGEEVWCQLFSEPGAGSDLANVSTRATRVDGGWRLTGQKVWTSGARMAQFGLAIARFDPTLPKHEGLVMLIVDMSSEGVEARPLRQMTGNSRFDEVFFDGAFVPDDRVVGAPGDGWRCARTTLSNERVSVGGNTALRGGSATMLAEEAQRTGAASDPLRRQQIANVWTHELIIHLMKERAKAALLAGEAPGPEGALNKLAASTFVQLVSGLGLHLSGADGIAWDPQSEGAGQWASRACEAPGLAIGGGTDEIVRNIVAERALGLPREPSVGRKDSFESLAAIAPGSTSTNQKES